MEAFIVFMVGSWVVQAIAAVVLAIVAAVRHRPFAAMGAVLGFAAGFGSFLVMSGPHFGQVTVFAVAPAAIAMIVSYGLARRWVPLATTLLLLAVPLACFLTTHLPSRTGIEWLAIFGLSSAPRPSISTTEFLATIGLMEVFFLPPILYALAGREVLGWLDRQAMQQNGFA